MALPWRGAFLPTLYANSIDHVWTDNYENQVKKLKHILSFLDPFTTRPLLLHRLHADIVTFRADFAIGIHWSMAMSSINNYMHSQRIWLTVMHSEEVSRRAAVSALQNVGLRVFNILGKAVET